MPPEPTTEDRTVIKFQKQPKINHLKYSESGNSIKKYAVQKKVGQFFFYFFLNKKVT
jgi:hypothetical protein